MFFAAEVPPADAITAGIYRELASTARIIWIVPGQLNDLMSPAFTHGGARILPDHRAIASEVVSLLDRTAADKALPGLHERSPQ